MGRTAHVVYFKFDTSLFLNTIFKAITLEITFCPRGTPRVRAEYTKNIVLSPAPFTCHAPFFCHAYPAGLPPPCVGWPVFLAGSERLGSTGKSDELRGDVGCVNY